MKENPGWQRKEPKLKSRRRRQQQQQQHQSEPHVRGSPNNASFAASSYRHRSGQRRADQRRWRFDRMVRQTIPHQHLDAFRRPPHAHPPLGRLRIVLLPIRTLLHQKSARNDLPRSTITCHSTDLFALLCQRAGFIITVFIITVTAGGLKTTSCRSSTNSRSSFGTDRAQAAFLAAERYEQRCILRCR